VVIHVIGLVLINESVVHVLSGAMERRRLMPKFAVVMSLVALLATVLHSIEVAAYRLLGALSDTKSAMLYSPSAMTSYGNANPFLEEQWQLTGALEAPNGDASLRADHRFSVCHDSEGLAAWKQRVALVGLEQDSSSWDSRQGSYPSDFGIVKYEDTLLE
jgi:hypothetical protein